MKIFNKYFGPVLVALLITVLGNSFAQSVDHWETIIQVGDDCKYIVPSGDISEWTTTGFDDTGWETAQSGVGYGDGDDITTIASGTLAIYLRFTFDVQDKSVFEALLLDMDFDDGFVAYLNGSEVARVNIPNPVSWDSQTSGLHEAAMNNGGMPDRFLINESIAANLVEGENVLAIEVHNESNTSSDMSSNVFLHVGLPDAESFFGAVPGWFTEPAEPVSYDEFNLPLVIINTDGVDIPKESPRIVADMGLIYNGEGQMNLPSDPWNEYSGKISIKRRGESSSGFEKRSYSLELQMEDGSNNNVSVLGMPEENDFVLYGPYSDKTMIKNVLTYELFRRTGRWAPRTRYVEVILNGDYRGVYVLTESLKRDENRVDIDKITEEDVTAEDISGGYILRRDKKNGLLANEWWTSPVDQPYHERMWYQYFDPKFEDLTTDQANYIKDWMQNFDQVMSSDSFDDPEKGYSNYVKVKSFIDMMFINEISKGIDNYLFSQYYHKENDADGGKLVAGAPWDYNLGYGNLNYGDDWDASESFGWGYPQGSRTYWFERLMEDDIYRNKVYCRWSDFRKNEWSDEEVMSIIDSCVVVLGDAVGRNFDKYKTLGQYVWPAKDPIPATYQGEIDNLKTWTLDRLQWIDGEWLDQGTCSLSPPSDILLNHNRVEEGLPIGTIVGEFSTEDTDEFDSHEYSLSSGEGDTDNDQFEISGNKLLTNEVFNMLTKTQYTIRVESKDTSKEKIEKSFEIIVTDELEVLGISDLGKNSFSIYPNPTTNSIQISSNNFPNENEVIAVMILDMTGAVYLYYKGTLQHVNALLGKESRLLSAGVYLARVVVADQVTQLKFIKI